MMILDGRKVAEFKKLQLKPRIEAFLKRKGRPPHLAVILVGDLTASQVYVRNKEKACEFVGMRSTLLKLSENCTQEELNACIDHMNANSDIDAVLVQLPLPAHLNSDQVLLRLSPQKDADGLTYQSLGLLWGGKSSIAPCTPKGVMEILKFYNILISGKSAVVVGRSNIVGKPMAHLLTQANATVTVCHSKTENISFFTKQADLVVVAAGQKHLLGKTDFKQGAVVVDVGIHGTGTGVGQLSGDVRFSELEGWVSAATPVPGGVGPMTIAMLLENAIQLAEESL